MNTYKQILSFESFSDMPFSKSDILFELAHLEGELSINPNCFMFEYEQFPFESRNTHSNLEMKSS